MDMKRNDLQIAYLAIKQEFTNLSELKYCLERQSSCDAPISLAHILIHEGYLSQQDYEYLQMILAASEKAGEEHRDPLLHSPDLSLEIIAREFTKSLDRFKSGGTFGKYRILDEIGRGGMGIVLKVEDEELEEIVALKILSAGPKADVKAIRGFMKEATIMMQLRHPNIVRVLEVGREKGLDYIAMEFVEGLSIADLLKERRPPVEQSLRIIAEVSRAISFIHSKGVYHRDLKPGNVVLDIENRPVLMDFGLASFDKLEGKIRLGSVGTPLYQSPEQAEVGGRFGEIGPPSDVYGLGATLYYMLTGRPPFLGPDKASVRHQVLNVKAENPSKYNKNIPPEVEHICLKCLEKRQEKRYHTPDDLREAINRFLSKKERPFRRRRP
jgi:serine/threonine protein kinase